MPSDEWEPISIIEKKVTRAADGLRITLDFRLSALPEPEWETGRQVVGTGKSGSAEYTFGPEPSLVGDHIVWDVPEEAMADAVSYVSRGVDAANQRFAQVLQRRRAEDQQREAREAQEGIAIGELQRKLDGL